MAQNEFTYVLSREEEDYWFKIAEFKSRDNAVDAAYHEYDNCKSDYKVTEMRNGHPTGWVIALWDYVLELETCPICGRKVRHMDMHITHDCRGIPFRPACPKCYARIMENGYDGEYYDESDECISETW